MVYFLFFIGIFCSIVLAGFISGAETAVTSASRAHLYHLAKKGNKRAEKLIALHENLSTSISTILILNQLVLYLIPIGSTLFSVKYLTTVETAILQTVLAFLIMIYAEIFPKMLVIKFTIPFVLFVGPLLSRAVLIMRPVTTVLELCAKYTLKIMRIRDESRRSSEQIDEELRGAIEMRPSKGNEEEAQKKNMLKSVLDLGEVSVSHIMVHRKNLMTISTSLPIEKIADMLSSCHFSRVPLWKDNPENIVGILKTKTFFQTLQLQDGKLETIKINQLASPPWFIPDTKHLLDQLQDFRKKREHFALVVDEYGDLQGCITLEDILEEIVGEIVDEYDTMTNGVKLQADGTIIAEGMTPIRDLNRDFDWDLPEDEATIAGYIMREVRKIPDVGQTYVLSGFKMEILKRQRNQIGLVKITPSTQQMPMFDV
ncbi:MAG: CNNM domain-containing protein [Holosporaceae bacterium]|jgi:Mg2+/Co2+ transporter CorB|nr:CNNM domain-containing protein [Holosporaceae bacterium]